MQAAVCWLSSSLAFLFVDFGYARYQQVTVALMFSSAQA
jgi:hypothetical protein